MRSMCIELVVPVVLFEDRFQAELSARPQTSVPFRASNALTLTLHDTFSSLFTPLEIAV